MKRSFGSTTLAGIVLAATIAASATTFLVTKRFLVPHHHPPPGWMQTYGPNRHSQHGEEVLIRHFFRDRREGFFVDVGASHYRDWSNTYYLERQLGWSGIAVDALEEYAADYQAHRPRTKYFPFFVSDVSGAVVDLHVPRRNKWVASGDKQFVEKFDAASTAVPVKTITLDDLLAREGVTRFDFLSLDVELGEPKVLAGFDIERFRPALVCVEGHEPVRQAILDYFARHRYVMVGSYVWLDNHNLYFQQLTADR
jgi:FkbM family methyltransferase